MDVRILITDSVKKMASLEMKYEKNIEIAEGAGIIDFDSPVAVTIQSEGMWRLPKGDEVEIVDGHVYLKTIRASWVKVTWAAQFAADATVLVDAWERVYGDLAWRPLSSVWCSPWYFTVREGELVRCLGVKTGPASFCSWTADRTSVTLLMDVRCGCLDTEFDWRRLELAELVQLQRVGLVQDVQSEFCRMMCPHPALPRNSIFGGDDWYAYYSDNSFELLVEHAKRLSACAEGLENRPYQMVDAGWQLCNNWYIGEEYIGGPYRYCNAKFKDMKALAIALKEVGTRPGLWIRPQETVEYVPNEAILRRVKNVKYLDPTHPAAREILDNDIRTFCEWGYEIIKWDFLVVDTFGRYLFHAEPSVPAHGDWTFYDRTRTSAEICLEYYRGTAALAPGVEFNVCNTFSHLSAGVFGSFRIGDDTSGTDWTRTVKYGVNALAYRAYQHGCFYAADPDCCGITDKIPWEKNRQWLRLLRYSGLPVGVSIQKEMFTSEVRDEVTEAFHAASMPHTVARPVATDDSLTPTEWMTFDGIKSFTWE